MDVELEETDDFNARGMRRVYGRTDRLGRHHTFHMDIWKAGDGRLLMRCWSRCEDIDWRSFEIKGWDAVGIPGTGENIWMRETLVPAAIRQAYNEWIEQEF